VVERTTSTSGAAAMSDSLFARERGQPVVADDNLDVGRDEVPQVLSMLVADDADARHVELARDGGQLAQLLAARHRHQFEGLGLAAQHVDRLGSDGAGGAQERDALHGRTVNPVGGRG
jgi:hypothetical protein